MCELFHKQKVYSNLTIAVVYHSFICGIISSLKGKQRVIYVDFKIANFLLGQKGSYARYLVFLCY